MPRRWIPASKDGRDVPTPNRCTRPAANTQEHRAVASDGFSAAHLLQLQRSVGNEVILRILASAAAGTASATPVPQPTNEAGQSGAAPHLGGALGSHPDAAPLETDTEADLRRGSISPHTYTATTEFFVAKGTPTIQREPGGTATGGVVGEEETASPDSGQQWQARGPWYQSRDQTAINIGAGGRASPFGSPSDRDQKQQNVQPGLAFDQEPSATAIGGTVPASLVGSPPDGGQQWQARGPWYQGRDQVAINIGARGRASPFGSPSDRDQKRQNVRPGLASDQEPSGDAGHPSMAKGAPGPANGGVPGALAPKTNKVAVSYANLRSRDAHYEHEFTLGAEGLKNVYTKALKHVEVGAYPSVAAYMQHNFGWRPTDTAKYFDKIPNIGTTSPDKPVVEAVAPQDRANYELSGGKTLIRGGGAKYDTSSSYSKYRGVGFGIFVMGANGKIYAGDHRIGLFHHSSLLAGGAVAGAGELKVVGGALKWITNKSGHYTPTAAQSIQVFAELQRRGIDLTSVDYTHLSAKSEINNSDRYPGKALAFYTKFKDDPQMADQ